MDPGFKLSRIRAGFQNIVGSGTGYQNMVRYGLNTQRLIFLSISTSLAVLLTKRTFHQCATLYEEPPYQIAVRYTANIKQNVYLFLRILRQNCQSQNCGSGYLDSDPELVFMRVQVHFQILFF